MKSATDEPDSILFDLWNTEVIKVSGMTCDGCGQRLTRALKRKSGVIGVEVDMLGSTATVTYDITKAEPQEIYQVVINSGFQPAAV